MQPTVLLTRQSSTLRLIFSGCVNFFFFLSFLFNVPHETNLTPPNIKLSPNNHVTPQASLGCQFMLRHPAVPL